MGSVLDPVISKDASIIGESTHLYDKEEEDNLQRTEDKFAYNKHSESTFDDERIFPCLKENNECVTFDNNNPEIINKGTLTAIVVHLTSPEIVDYNMICDFFLTYRIFTNSETVMELLLTRLIWSLQYINSNDESKTKIGKLVLLRTFVVIRHWIINYFIDDFDPKPELCEKFSSTINEITQSTLVDKSMVYEVKILGDLKIHWLSVLQEFWKFDIDIDNISDIILDFPLPSTSNIMKHKKLSKSNTEMSIHTNPSYRRSAMLSLYDQKTHHKCIVFDKANTENENPQLSMNNLLLEHKTSRMSLNFKLSQFQEEQGSKVPPIKASQHSNNSTKHNYLSLKDSSLELKKTTRKSGETNLNHKAPEVGFSTNGKVRLPTSKVEFILPPTPVKKMDYVLKNSTPLSPTKKSVKQSSSTDDITSMTRNKSIKKLVDNWKRSFNGSRLESENIESLNNQMETNSIMNEKIQVDTLSDPQIDLLSARIVDELEFLIRSYICSTNDTEQEKQDRDVFVDVEDNANFFNQTLEMSSPGKKTLNSRNNDLMEDTNSDESDMDINDLSDLNILKIDNLINNDGEVKDEGVMDNDLIDDELMKNVMLNNSGQTSFQRPVSINWNDEGDLDLDNSDIANEETKNKSIINREGKVTTQYFDTESSEPMMLDSKATFESVSTPSNFSQYDAEVSDLGIALSPQLKDQRPTRISISEVDKRRSTISKRSLNSIFRQDSAKSYVSYDSDISMSNRSRDSLNENNMFNLRKKHGYNNLRSITKPGERKSLEISPFNYSSLNSFVSRSSSLRKSIRFSTLCALTELPFSTEYGDMLTLDKKVSRNTQLSTRLSDPLHSSIFSIVRKSRRASGKCPDESNNSSTNSVVIPGISNYVLKELAEIPDESLQSNDPVEFALYKLEGKRSQRKKRNKIESVISSKSNEKHSRQGSLLRGVDDSNLEENNHEDMGTRVSDEDKQDQIEEELERNVDEKLKNITVEDTQDILDAINNAQTADVIELESINEKSLEDEGNNITPLAPSSYQYVPFRKILDTYCLTNQKLSTTNAMENRTHISFVLGSDSRSLAEHFTMIEKDLLQEIDWRELIELNWNHELTPVNSWLEIIVNDTYYSTNKGVNLVISRFNLMVNWIISEILLTKREEDQINLISRFIHIAQNCFSLQNYSTLIQILLALNSEKVQKLKSTWVNLAPGDILMLKNLDEVSSPLRNFMNIRLCINKMKPSNGCIPFVGLYLSDLIFNAERPNYVKLIVKATELSDTSMKENTEITASTISGDQMERLINFSKFRTSVHIVKSLSQCIEWSSYYDFKVNPELLSKCLYIKSLDEDEMNYCLSKLI